MAKETNTMNSERIIELPPELEPFISAEDVAAMLEAGFIEIVGPNTIRMTPAGHAHALKVAKDAGIELPE